MDMGTVFENLDEQWREWYLMTPQERFAESQKLFALYLQMGGSLDPDPDTQSPFNAVMQECRLPADGRPGLHLVRRGAV